LKGGGVGMQWGDRLVAGRGNPGFDDSGFGNGAGGAGRAKKPNMF